MSAVDNEKTRVVFRMWPSAHEGECIALFPDIQEGRGRCSSYEHVGQHAPADYAGVVKRTRPATPDEYKALAAELTNLGYKLDIRKHC